MGFFDLFKKKESSAIKCTQCSKSLSKTECYKLLGEPYCRECFKAKTSPEVNVPKKHSFEMIVESVFFVENKGVVLKGTIKAGVVRFGDTVTVNNKEYKVIGIELCEKLSHSAKEGDIAGVLIETFDPQNFQKGDIVFASTDCSDKQNAAIDDKPSESKDNVLNLGTFSFSDTDRERIKAAAIRYMPADLGTAAAQSEVLKSLSGVMDVAIIELKTRFLWQNVETAQSNKEQFNRALIETILSVNHLLSCLNPGYLISKVNDASPEEMLKGWIVLDYYAHILKPEHTANIQNFRDYIHSILLKYENTESNLQPIKYDGTTIHLDTKVLSEWKKSHPLTPQFEYNAVMALTEKEPVISLCEDGVKTVEYRLQTEGEENFTGKYFQFSVRVGSMGNPAVPTMQIDGFISDTPEDRQMAIGDIGYRMEGHYLACGAELSKQRYSAVRGQDLVAKGLKYQGYTTPSNVRLIGICPDCGRSFTFHGYAFYMAQNDVAYSDDGLDVCEITPEYTYKETWAQDKETWKYEADGKTFRFYNSFNCPHCGTPYIDYKKHPENKVFGVCGCVHLGRKVYTAE